MFLQILDYLNLKKYRHQRNFTNLPKNSINQNGYSERPIIPDEQPKTNNFAKTFGNLGFSSSACFQNRDKYNTFTDKVWNKLNPPNKERDPYFQNFIRDEHIENMPDYKNQLNEVVSLGIQNYIFIQKFLFSISENF